MISWTDFTPDSETFSAQRPALLKSVNNLSVAVDSAVCLNHFDHVWISAPRSTLFITRFF